MYFVATEQRRQQQSRVEGVVSISFIGWMLAMKESNHHDIVVTAI